MKYFVQAKLTKQKAAKLIITTTGGDKFPLTMDGVEEKVNFPGLPWLEDYLTGLNP